MPESSRYQWIPARLRRLALIPLAAIGVLLGLLVAPSPPTASAAVLFGHDISWPQCPSAFPPTSTQFLVIGLTNGLPFTENPCLASQAARATGLAKPTHAYTMAGFPTAAQLITYGSSGPWSASSRAGRLSNVGYAEASYAAASIRRVAGWQPRMVWIDVEPRDTAPRRQPWPSSTAAQRQENRYVIEGIMRGLRAAGFSYGLYANSTGWQSITGSWWVPGVPVWATAGRLDYPTEALDRCTQPSFSGGKVYLAQWWDDVWDYDRTCGTYDFGALPMPASNLSASTGDFNGDWRGDVVARWTSGALKLYAGNGNGSHAAGVTIGTNWSAYSTLETVGDLSGDGSPDVVVRQRTNGYLWMFRGTGKGAFIAPAILLGTGWNVMNAIVGPGDLNGDQRV
ncbi:MAG: FG-GAP-like repeat-containing protein, partial [Terrabacter sp.]